MSDADDSRTRLMLGGIGAVLVLLAVLIVVVTLVIFLGISIWVL